MVNENKDIRRTKLPLRIKNALTAANIKTVGDLILWGPKKIRGIGIVSREIIKKFLNTDK